MTPEDEHRFALMEQRIDLLEQEAEGAKARAMANFALLRSLVAVLPSRELAALERTFDDLSEQLTIQFMYASWSEATNEIAAASYEDWLDVMRTELKARHEASNPKP
ncbi:MULTISPECIES: hypothetical protein [Variovorax]|uniref:hypothetical protein n=1 Tax=Variovorax TaxID=34072 RepID=UPI002860B4BD|nr:hypothetical protein [Variovorax sp. 3319]MDR6886109.1 hypothetical protein [Variovorax sp. 3319]